jgi:hypothetical protein
MIRWQDEVIKVVNIQETDTHVIVYGIDEMDYEVEVEIPDCETVPLVVWD